VKVRILVVGEEGEVLAAGLRRHGHEVVTVETGAAAWGAHAEAELVLLDFTLPDGGGVAVCRRIRSACEVPVIVFTESHAEFDRVQALRAGADDCVDKPYGFRELLARIDVVMRRARACVPGRRTAVTIGALRIDAASREVILRDRQIDLTRKEFDLLHYLALHPDTVVTRHRLMTEIWKNQASARPSRTIDTHLRSLRTKLGRNGWIVTVRGVGFRIGHG
jgi:DNA-binding response OmpR family regulator